MKTAMLIVALAVLVCGHQAASGFHALDLPAALLPALLWSSLALFCLGVEIILAIVFAFT